MEKCARTSFFTPSRLGKASGQWKKLAELAFRAPSDSIEADSQWKISARMTQEAFSHTIDFDRPRFPMENFCPDDSGSFSHTIGFNRPRFPMENFCPDDSGSFFAHHRLRSTPILDGKLLPAPQKNSKTARFLQRPTKKLQNSQISPKPHKKAPHPAVRSAECGAFQFNLTGL